MLVQFKVRNFLSFKNESILDMSAISSYKEHQYNLIDVGIKDKFLKVAAIYGANASGKSNLYLALRNFQKIIRESLNNEDEDGLTAIAKYYAPFLFDNDIENTEFEIIIIRSEYEYRYGYEYNDKQIVSEWLYKKSLKTNRKSIIFERYMNKTEFGASVKSKCDAYKEQVPSETLVLSFLNRLKLKTDVYSTVYAEIMSTLVEDSDFYEDEDILESCLPQVIDKDKEGLVKFLKAIDAGILDIGYTSEDKEIFFYTMHTSKSGKSIPISLFSESEGTIKSIVIYIYAKVAIEYDKSLFVDELNIKLHPLLLKFIIDLFNSKNSKAQLIYTTHDTTLMDKKFFRRDQIWFVQKDEFGCSELVALSDFKIRADASFEKDYLAGVYGGIPLLSEFELKEGE